MQFIVKPALLLCEQETDVLVLLIDHIEQMQCDEVWMEADRYKNAKIIPVKQVYATWRQNCHIT